MAKVPKLLTLLVALIVMVMGLALAFGDWQHGSLGHELATTLGMVLIFVVGVAAVFGDHLRRW